MDTTNMVVNNCAQGMVWDYRLMIDLVLAVLAIVSLVVAYCTRQSMNKLRDNYIKDVEAMNNNLTKFAADVAQQLDNATALAHLAPAIPVVESPVTPVVETPASKPSKPSKPVISTIYLSKPDDGGTFVRASRDFELGNSIFVLTTIDGIRGEFAVIDNSDVHRFALMMPSENLTRACTGQDIQMSAGKTRIVTDQTGVATLVDGKWHVTTRATIHYE